MPGRRFLFKSEPGEFSIDHLARAKAGTTSWGGIRNYQARNLLRDEVRKGDLVLFWHSSAEPTGAAGVCEVVRESYPDPLQFDRKSPYHDGKSTKADPRWLAVDVRFVRKFRNVVTPEALRARPDLAGMDVLRRGNRLSVQRVTHAEFDAVVAMADAAKR
jgi:predicted RNA-binding protein with PUA-like domain